MLADDGRPKYSSSGRGPNQEDLRERLELVGQQELAAWRA